MKMGAAGIALVKRFEGCRLEAYPDPGSPDGKPCTIGYGSTGADIVPGLVWTQEQADARLMVDLTHTSASVERLIPVATQNQFDALCSFAYNVGTAALATSTLRKMHNAGDYSAAAGEFPKWNHNNGIPMAGLTKRRAAEQTLYLMADT